MDEHGSPPALAARDLLTALRTVRRALGAAVQRRAARSSRVHPPGSPELWLSGEQALGLLDEVDSPPEDGRLWLTPTPAEEADRVVLRERAAAAGITLPLDRLIAELELDALEVGWLLTCAAPEIDSTFGRLFGFVLDDLTRSRPCVELLVALSGAGYSGLTLRAGLGPFGTLRRCRLLEAVGESVLEFRQELRLTRPALRLLLGQAVDPAAFRDPDEVQVAPSERVPAGADAARVRRLGAALRDGRLAVAGIWGGDPITRERAAAAAAAAGRLPLRRFQAELDSAALVHALAAAAALGAALLVELDGTREVDSERLDGLERALAATSVRLILAARDPWRPRSVLALRSYAEVQLEPPTYAARRRMWSDAMPELTTASTSDLAARYLVGAAEARAAVMTARAEAAVRGNGAGPTELVAPACAMVSRRRSYRFATLMAPRRTLEDLVLPDVLHAQVREIASFYRDWQWVSEDWGLARHGTPGMSVLFAGDPGTGKTLAAEVIAGMLALDLLKVDLGRVVSKWVGETERNLEATFDEAESSASVLFFDEADSLFARRGEIRHGTDRYANLEVGFLLQRLESVAGLVILATNLRENLDDAFTRRFNVIVHFPRPGVDERRRMWRLMLPPLAPAADVDVAALADLEMTGAAIAAAARTAALLAAGEGGTEITMRHAVQAVARQFRREGRVLSKSELGTHAALV